MSDSIFSKLKKLIPKLKKLILKDLFFLNFQISGRTSTPKKNVIELIRKLHPYQTQLELIRIGPNEDGGYLVPNDLKGIKACFSPGVSNTYGFEEQCYKDYKIKIFMADNSVDKPKITSIPKNKYSFLKKHIGIQNNDKFTTMDEWVNSSSLPHKSDLLLQMDIEGAEYLAILNMSDSLLKRFRVIVIEFHYLSEFLWNYIFFSIINEVFKKLLQNHVCVHIHPNNVAGKSSLVKSRGITIPSHIELTFIRKDRVTLKGHCQHFPHKLDADNVPRQKHVSLPKDWYRND